MTRTDESIGVNRYPTARSTSQKNKRERAETSSSTRTSFRVTGAPDRFVAAGEIEGEAGASPEREQKKMKFKKHKSKLHLFVN